MMHDAQAFRRLKARLAAGKPGLGLVLTSPSVAFAELAGLTGVHYAWIDMA
jgi:2-keto-3-deoxy-L-rhamnonate aldolase RhmA